MEHFSVQAAFQSLLPSIVQVIGQTLESGDEASAKSGFEVIEGLTLAVGGSRLKSSRKVLNIPRFL